MSTNRRKFRLLTKSTIIYLVFTFAAFFFSALFLYNETQEYINNELENRYNWTVDRITNEIEIHGKIRRERPYINVTKVNEIPKNYITPIYKDTLVDDQERDMQHLIRKKIIYSEINEAAYKFVMIQDITDFKKLQDDIFAGLIPAFIILALVIVIFNYFLSEYFFSPFNKILKRISAHKIGSGSEISEVTTNTSEFVQMQSLLIKMVERTEKEFSTLKEYTENMAHEIQTPLTVIRNKVENLISDENLMKAHSGTVKTIYNEINHLSKLGSSLNLLTKVEHGEFSNKVDIQTKQIIENHVEGISELLALKELKIELELSESHKINIDPILLDIVIKNLLNNSLNYASNIGPILIKTSEKELKISNFGEPLSFSEKSIFNRFSKSNSHSSSLGLGLALVHKICSSNDLQIEYKYDDEQHQFIITKIKP